MIKFNANRELSWAFLFSALYFYNSRPAVTLPKIAKKKLTVSFFWNVDQKITKFHIRQKSENKTSDLDFEHFRVCSILEKTDIQIFEIFEYHFCHETFFATWTSEKLLNSRLNLNVIQPQINVKIRIWTCSRTYKCQFLFILLAKFYFLNFTFDYRSSSFKLKLSEISKSWNRHGSRFFLILYKIG